MDHQHELPEHVRRIIDRDEPPQFTPPSFERWLGRLQMTRTLASMAAFMVVWLVAFETGSDWAGASVRGIMAALVFHFFAWAACLFVFGEMYEVEVKEARIKLEERERDRARRIEEYYRDRLRAQGILPPVDGDAQDGGAAAPSLGSVAAMHQPPSSYQQGDTTGMRSAA